MWLDLLTGTLFIIAILQGYRNGLIRAMLSFLSLFIGLVLAFQLAGWVSAQLKSHTKIASNFLPFISFLIVLIVVLLVIRWVSALLQQTAEWLMLGWLNKLLGILLYAFIYCTMLSAVVYFLLLLGVIEVDKINKAYSFPYLQSWWPYCMHQISRFLPSVKSTLAGFSAPLK